MSNNTVGGWCCAECEWLDREQAARNARNAEPIIGGGMVITFDPAAPVKWRGYTRQDVYALLVIVGCAFIMGAMGL